MIFPELLPVPLDLSQPRYLSTTVTRPLWLDEDDGPQGAIRWVESIVVSNGDG